MPRIIVENVSLVFPLYSRAEARGVTNSGVGDDRLISSEDGRILGVRALEDLSFTIEQGDRVALIGRNGSGKTTLLQILAGIISPDTGTVAVEGQSTNLININLGMQIEASGDENITLRGLAAGYSRKLIEERRAQIAEFSELGEFLSMPILTYSAGMRMRLNFAIATAFEPEILLLDEWLSAGDAAFRKKATNRMKEFADKAGILVLASHSWKMLLDNCNRAIWLKAGRIYRSGAVSDVLNEYEDELGENEKSEKKSESAS